MARDWRALVLTMAAAGAMLGLLATQVATASVHDEASCARPALWVVNDADTILYLFGTIQTHDGRAHWFDHAVRRRSDSSNSLMLETVLPARLPSTAEAPSGSGLSAERATMGASRSIGMRVDLGADQVLHGAPGASGKPVIGLESFAEQLEMYRSLPLPARPAAPAASPAAVAADLDRGSRHSCRPWSTALSWYHR